MADNMGYHYTYRSDFSAKYSNFEYPAVSHVQPTPLRPIRDEFNESRQNRLHSTERYSWDIARKQLAIVRKRLVNVGNVVDAMKLSGITIETTTPCNFSTNSKKDDSKNIIDVNDSEPEVPTYELNKENINKEFMRLLRKLTLTAEQLRFQGFPIQHGNCVTYFSTRKSEYQSPSDFDKMLQEFYANSLPSFKTPEVEWFCQPISAQSYYAALKKECARCSSHFYVNAESGNHILPEECYYHWGKLRRGSWECCYSSKFSQGCTTAAVHVWSGTVPGDNGPFYDYVYTESPQHQSREINYGVFGIDCEMIFTRKGMELAQVSLVDICGRVIYEALVKPEAPIIDYNTRFSGLRKSDLEMAKKTLSEVQQDILRLINKETILIGHSLENDLRALKIIHNNIIDTSVLYPHSLGPPLRRGLKDIAKTVLNRRIQETEHDSKEDARTAINLVLHKMHTETK